MNKLLTGVCAAGMAVAVAGTATAQTPTQTDHQNAAKYCKALRTSSGSPEAFAEAVKAVAGAKKVTVKNAYGKCVSSQSKNEATDAAQALSTAKSDCKTEQAQSDTDFAAGHGGKTFAQQYGTNKNGKNAYGKCVSQHARAEEKVADQENANEVSAAKKCKAEKASVGADAFAQQYGTNKNKKNAFGKCVSSKSKAMDQADEQEQQQETETPPATA